MPDDVVVLAVEASDLASFFENLTPDVEAAIPKVPEGLGNAQHMKLPMIYPGLLMNSDMLICVPREAETLEGGENCWGRCQVAAVKTP